MKLPNQRDQQEDNDKAHTFLEKDNKASTQPSRASNGKKRREKRQRRPDNAMISLFFNPALHWTASPRKHFAADPCSSTSPPACAVAVSPPFWAAAPALRRYVCSASRPGESTSEGTSSSQALFVHAQTKVKWHPLGKFVSLLVGEAGRQGCACPLSSWQAASSMMTAIKGNLVVINVFRAAPSTLLSAHDKDNENCRTSVPWPLSVARSRHDQRGEGLQRRGDQCGSMTLSRRPMATHVR